MVKLNIFVFSHPVTGTPRPFTLSVNTQDGTAGINIIGTIMQKAIYVLAVSPSDYGSVSGQLIQFNTGDTDQTHTITIAQNDLCENDPNEYFFSNITLVSGIDVIQPLATVFIDDTRESECGM